MYFGTKTKKDSDLCTEIELFENYENINFLSNNIIHPFKMLLHDKIRFTGVYSYHKKILGKNNAAQCSPVCTGQILKIMIFRKYLTNKKFLFALSGFFRNFLQFPSLLPFS